VKRVRRGDAEISARRRAELRAAKLCDRCMAPAGRFTECLDCRRKSAAKRAAVKVVTK